MTTLEILRLRRLERDKEDEIVTLWLIYVKSFLQQLEMCFSLSIICFIC